jgi:hypothetical protein
MNFAWIHVSYLSNFKNKLICIDTYELVSIHSSSVWTECYSCIDTCLHASIHVSEKPTCIDTNVHLYRYKRVKTDFVSTFTHSFIKTPNTSSSTRKSHQKPSFPKFSISLKTQSKLTKLDTKSLQILCSFTFLLQYCGSILQYLHIQDKGLQFWCV